MRSSDDALRKKRAARDQARFDRPPVIHGSAENRCKKGNLPASHELYEGSMVKDSERHAMIALFEEKVC